MPVPTPDSPMTFALIGAGFWSQYQLAAWEEISDVQCIGIVDQNLARARTLAEHFEIDGAFSSIDELFQHRMPTFVDIVSSVESHAPLVRSAAEQGMHVICQKPLATSLDDAGAIVQFCQQVGVQLAVHENWRWQRPIRELKGILDRQPIGRLFRARLNYNNSFPVFDNQPALKDLDEFILSDMGTHLFDVVRFLFGEPQRLCCEVNRSRSDIRGEDVASVLLRMESEVTVLCNMSYASRLEHDRFPETLLLVEGEAGSIALDHDYWISVTTEDGTTRRRFPPTWYPWVDSRYAVVHSSIVECHRHLATSIRNNVEAETCGRDNLKTLSMIDAAYQSARTHQVVALDPTRSVTADS